MKLLEDTSKQNILKTCKEHEIAKHCFDSQVNELCAMLEKYKVTACYDPLAYMYYVSYMQIENLKIVTQKDREIETFQQRLTEVDALKVSISACPWIFLTVT